jgi:hypothetical protein
MGLIHIALFATLDLVGQGPGGPDGLTSMGVGDCPLSSRLLVTAS